MIRASSYSAEFVWCGNHNVLAEVDETSDVLILTLCYEARDPNMWAEQFFNVVKNLRTRYPMKKICLIANSWYAPYLTKLDVSLLDDVVTVDFFLMLVYNRLFNHHESQPATSWNIQFDKFLFLTGKIEKPQRIRLFYKFYCAGLLNKAEWSLYLNDKCDSHVPACLPELSPDQIHSFIQQHLRNPDQVDVITSDNSFHYSGIPFDSNLYYNCMFQVISETNFDNQYSNPWITEKTWLAIVNRRPFILAGDVGSLKKLKNLGFRTFENYLLYPEYDNINDPEERLDIIVKNTEAWLHNIHTQYNDIKQDIEHNFKRLIDIATENFNKVEQLIDRYKISNLTVEGLVDLKDRIAHAQWKAWYNRIRDPDWPECLNEEDFVNLPERIQKECIEVFNYQPKENT